MDDLRRRLVPLALAVSIPAVLEAAQALPDEPVEIQGLDRVELELTLEDALELALANNLDLQIAEEETSIVEFEYLGSWGAFEWVFDASASYTNTERVFGISPQIPGGLTFEGETAALNTDFTRPLQTGGSFVAHFDSTAQINQTFDGDESPDEVDDTLRFSYVQPLRRGAWKEYSTSTQREREIQFAQQLETRRRTRQELLLSVYNAYWGLVSAREQRGVADSSLELGLEQFHQNQRRLEAGVGTEVDVLQAEAEVASRMESLLRAETDVHQAMDDLKMLIFGSEDDALWNTDLLPGTPLPEEVSIEGLPTWSQALMTALDNRPALKQQRLEVDVARVRHSRTLSERLAQVDLTLTYSSTATDFSRNQALEDTFSLDRPTYFALLSYSMPIGNKTADNAERAARALVRVALLQYDKLELEAVSAVRRAVRDVQYQKEAVSASVKSLKLALRQLEAEEARYSEGLSTTFQVLEFQQSLIEAMRNERNARVQFELARVSLKDAMGVIGEEDI